VSGLLTHATQQHTHRATHTPPYTLPPNSTPARYYRALRVDEINSISNNGLRGVSDTMSGAMWSLDAAMEVAASGAVGVNFHCASKEEGWAVFFARVEREYVLCLRGRGRGRDACACCVPSLPASKPDQNSCAAQPCVQGALAKTSTRR
jgi:hypothetical protein